MRILVLAAATLATALPISGASAQYWGGGYNNRVRQEQRECQRELRRADSRREYRHELRECQREISRARREQYRDRYDRRYRDGDRWRYR